MWESVEKGERGEVGETGEVREIGEEKTQEVEGESVSEALGGVIVKTVVVLHVWPVHGEYDRKISEENSCYA